MNYVKEFSKMNLDELRAVQLVLKKYIDAQVNQQVGSIGIGDIVKVNHFKTSGMKFKVVKINRTKMKLQSINDKYLIYNVSLGLIEKA